MGITTPYEKLLRIWFGRAKLEALKTLSLGHPPLPIRRNEYNNVLSMADWGRINGYPFVGFSSPIAPYEKLPRIWFCRAKLEALKTLSLGRLLRFQFAGMNITPPPDGGLGTFQQAFPRRFYLSPI